MGGNFLLAIHLFLQLTVILLTCRVTGWLLRYLGQTQVVSEMVAGVLLGPSLLGLLFPKVQQFLFPAGPSMSILYALSQIGLVLYMFLIGMEFRTELLARHSKDALFISLSGIGLPVLLGGGLGFLLVRNPDVFNSSIVPWQAALFLASAMSITAFPMLARILYESGLSRTKIGTLTLGAAAFDDAAAWCLLASFIASQKRSPVIAALAIGGGAVYALFMVFIGRPLFRWFGRRTEQDGEVRVETIGILMVGLMFCAWITDYVGIYSVFGAFIAGAVMPRGKFVEGTSRALENVTVSLLLPTFFVYSGLNTRMNLLVQPSLFGVTLLIIAVSFLCKGGGCLAASRLVGASWREATSVGVLMNARGLMELILINIARDRGLITDGLFSILVLMAIVTTLAASPLFNLLYPPGSKHRDAVT